MFVTSHDDAPGQSGTGARGVDLGPQSRVGAVLDEVPVTEHSVAEPDGPTVRQWIVAAHGEDEGVMAEIGGGQPGPIDGAVDEGDVELAVGHGPRQLARRRMSQTKSDPGVGLAEP